MSTLVKPIRCATHSASSGYRECNIKRVNGSNNELLRLSDSQVRVSRSKDRFGTSSSPLRAGKVPCSVQNPNLEPIQDACESWRLLRQLYHAPNHGILLPFSGCVVVQSDGMCELLIEVNGSSPA